MPLGDTSKLRQRIGRQRGDRNAGLFGRGPKPVKRALVQPALCRIVQKRIPQTEHPRLLAPLAIRSRDSGSSSGSAPMIAKRPG